MRKLSQKELQIHW